MCYTTFEELPREIIEHIAFYVSQDKVTGPPTALLTLLVLSKKLFAILDPSNEENHSLYARIFKDKFDYASVERRWCLLRHIEGRREKRALMKSARVESHRDLKFDVQQQQQTPVRGASTPKRVSPWAPLTSTDLAVELKRRFRVMHAMRAAVRAKAAYDQGRMSRPSSPRMYAHNPHAVDEESGIPEADEATQILWTCYLMLIESDGRNLAQLSEYGMLQAYMALFYQTSLLNEALNPGWPRETIGRALGLWIGWLGGDDISAETSEESEQRFFVLKPYVFAAHRFDGFFAPWTIRKLPVSLTDYPIQPPPADAVDADLRPRTNANVISYMGRSITFTAPVLSHAAIFSFFQRKKDDSLEVEEVPGPSTSAFNSETYDLDFARISLCVNPYTSRGLPTLFCRGSLAGSWEGRFSFFDFDSYREMLGGQMRALYEGPFGDQPNVWKIEETIVKRRKGEPVGGKGPISNAGFTSDGMSLLAHKSTSAKKSKTDDFPDYLDSICDDHDDHEILLTGSGHSAWGKFALRGRVRSYDGMFTLVKQYTPDDRGRWLYRGYCTGGHLVGRWRDTWSPIDQNAYEGTFLMTRRAA